MPLSRILLLALLACSTGANAQLTLDPERPAPSLESALEIHPDASLPLDAVMADSPGFSKASSFIPSEGAPEAYWARVVIRSASDEPTEWVIPLSLHEVAVAIVRGSGEREQFRTGSNVPISERPLLTALPTAFPLRLAPREEVTMYARIDEPASSYRLSHSFVPIEAGAHDRAQQKDTLLQGLFLGVLIALAIYNLFLFTFFQDRSYLYYILFLLATATYWAVGYGHLFDVLWPKDVAPYDELHFFALAAAAAMYIQFVRSYLVTAVTAVAQDRVLRGMLALWASAAVMGALGHWLLASNLAAFTALVTLFTTFSAGIRAHISGYKPAMAYLLAAGLFIAAGLMYIVLFLFLPEAQHTYGRPLLQIAMLFEVFMLGVALSVRIRILTRAKMAAETAREKAEATTTALQEADGLKTQLLGIAAHDLRSPLTGIVGFAEFIEDETPERPDLHDMTAAIRRGAMRMLHLIEDLLVVSAIDGGQIRLEPRPTDLSALISDVVDEYRSRADAKGQSLTLNLPQAPPLADVDPDRCHAIVDNLVSNAVKYTPRGGSVHVDLASGDREILISVRDTGPGLSAEDRQGLFKRFQTLTPRPTGDESASGLGLSIAQQLAELHGGAIQVESEEGQGSTFTLVLPHAPATAEGSAPEESRQLQIA